MKSPVQTAFLFLLVGTTTAQVPFFKTHAMDEPFKRARPELVYEDHNGVLWFGTKKGLFLYDGIEFHPFQKKDTTSNYVRAVFRDSKNRLWAGYEDGSIYLVERQQLLPWQAAGDLPETPVRAIGEDGGGNIWMSAFGEGLFCFDGTTLHHFSTANGLPTNYLRSMATDAGGHTWFGSDKGIASCSFTNNTIAVEIFAIENGPPNDTVTSILPSKDGRLWFGTSKGRVGLFDPETKKTTYPLPRPTTGPVNCLEQFEGTDLWIGTQGNGIWRYSFAGGTLEALPGFEEADVADLLRDIEGNIWALTNIHGIQSANRQFELLRTHFKNVTAMTSDAQNRLWIGTPGGLFLYQPGATGDALFQPHLPKAGLHVSSLAADSFGNIWVGTAGEGLFVYKPASGAMRHLAKPQQSGSGHIYSIAVKGGLAWLATRNGALKAEIPADIFDGGPPAFKMPEPLAGLGTIYSVFIDSHGRTWFGTDGQGLSVLENGRAKSFPFAEHAAAQGEADQDARMNTVYSIAEDKGSHIWFCTDKAGIFEFDGETFEHLTLKEGIRDLETLRLATDANGHIIIVHPSGIDVLTPASKHLIYYEDEVGIREFGSGLNAACTDRLGNVWVAGKNVIIKYTALKEELEIDPRTLLSNVSVLLEPIDFSQSNTFSYRENHLAFSYMGLWYTDPQAVKYRYRLVGYDLGWIESRDRRATYSNLPPGAYTFEVMSTENEAWADEPIVSYSFRIKPPLWMRWWFFAMLLPAVGGLFYWYQKNRDRRIQLVNLMEKDKAENKLATLKAQINPHFLFNSFNTLISVVEKTPELAVEYIENLSDFYRKIMQLRDKDLIPIQEEIALLKNFTYLLNKRYGNNFGLIIDLPQKSWFIVPLTLQLLVENSVKHNVISKSKPLTIRISADEAAGYITVANNFQPKLTEEKSTYFGLQSLVQRYGYLIARKVKVEQDGKEFRVSIPIIN